MPKGYTSRRRVATRGVLKECNASALKSIYKLSVDGAHVLQYTKYAASLAQAFVSLVSYERELRTRLRHQVFALRPAQFCRPCNAIAEVCAVEGDRFDIRGFVRSALRNVELSASHRQTRKASGI